MLLGRRQACKVVARTVGTTLTKTSQLCRASDEFCKVEIGGETTRRRSINLMTSDGCHAKIEHDAELGQFRGEIFGLSRGADFWTCLDVFLEVKAQGIEPRRNFSGKFNLRSSPELHEKLALAALAALAAQAQGKSINSLAQEALLEHVTG